MSEKYIGCNLSLEVGGGLGFYQGKVKSVNSERQSITLTKVIHNGIPSPALEVTICAQDILSLNLLTNKDGEKCSTDMLAKEKDEPETKKIEPETKKVEAATLCSPVGFQPFKPPIKADNSPTIPTFGRGGISVVETIAHGSHTSPRPIPERPNGGQSSDQNGQKRNSNSRSLPRGRRFHKYVQHGVNDRNETTFGTQIGEEDLEAEFDFEKNLALFDKQAVMDEISGTKPDVVGQTDQKFRCDQNVLKSKVNKRQIIVPSSGAGDVIYTTDNGLLVPSINDELRLDILSNANQHGFTTSRQLEMIGRGATEVIVSAIGGSHRLEPGNSHQTPIVVVVCGAHEHGAAGASCARQLESQGVRTFILTPPTNTTSPACILLQQELQIYALTEGKAVSSVQDLPFTVDLIVDTRYDLYGQLGVRAPAWLSSISTWASSSRAPVVALDPPSDLTPVRYPIQTRLKLCSVLPLVHLPDKGKLYLLNINIPVQVFAQFQITYFSPFGANMTIPLHPCQ